MVPKGFEEVSDRPGALGVKTGGLIISLLIGIGALALVGGVALLFAPAKESASTDTLWPVGLIFIVLGAFCLVIYRAVTRKPKYILDDVGLHSQAFVGRVSVHWDGVEKLQPYRGGLWLSAPGAIYSKDGKITKKKRVQVNTQGLACGAQAFVDQITQRVLQARSTGPASPADPPADAPPI